MWYLRFVVLETHEDSHCLMGVFQACYRLRPEFDGYEEAWLQRTLWWFDDYLAAPDRFSRPGRPSCAAICWFRDSATIHIARIRDLTALLEHHGVITLMLRTDRPGYIVYEDRYQVAAIPFRETPA